MKCAHPGTGPKEAKEEEEEDEDEKDCLPWISRIPLLLLLLLLEEVRRQLLLWSGCLQLWLACHV